MTLWIFAAWGALGQFIRSCIGLKKAIQSGEQINWGYWIGTMILGAIIGAVAGVLAQGVTQNATWLVSFIAGYAGTDFIEGVVKRK